MRAVKVLEEKMDEIRDKLESLIAEVDTRPETVMRSGRPECSPSSRDSLYRAGGGSWLTGPHPDDF